MRVQNFLWAWVRVINSISDPQTSSVSAHCIPKANLTNLSNSQTHGSPKVKSETQTSRSSTHMSVCSCLRITSKGRSKKVAWTKSRSSAVLSLDKRTSRIAQSTTSWQDVTRVTMFGSIHLANRLPRWKAPGETLSKLRLWESIGLERFRIHHRLAAATYSRNYSLREWHFSSIIVW